MTKLEQKLIELGYKKVFYDDYEKPISFDETVKICIRLDRFNEKIRDKVLVGYTFKTQQSQFDLEQLAFNEFQKDLEIIKECEE